MTVKASGVSSGDAVPLGAVRGTAAGSMAQRMAVSAIDHDASAPGPTGAVRAAADAMVAKRSSVGCTPHPAASSQP